MCQDHNTAVLSPGPLHHLRSSSTNFIQLLAKIRDCWAPVDGSAVLPVVEELPLKDVGVEHLTKKVEGLVIVGDHNTELRTLDLVSLELLVVGDDVCLRRFIPWCFVVHFDC